MKRLVEQRSITGLRIDHVDGLRDPLAYLNRLREQTTQGGDSEPTTSPIYVEKILASDERLPRDWPVAGTTGYDFLNALNRFFIEPSGTSRFEQIYSKFLGKDLPYNDVL